MQIEVQIYILRVVVRTAAQADPAKRPVKQDAGRLCGVCLCSFLLRTTKQLFCELQTENGGRRDVGSARAALSNKVVVPSQYMERVANRTSKNESNKPMVQATIVHTYSYRDVLKKPTIR